jgi:hypothetical protein
MHSGCRISVTVHRTAFVQLQRSAALNVWEDDHEWWERDLEGGGRRCLFTVSRTEGNCEYIQIKIVGVGARV